MKIKYLLATWLFFTCAFVHAQKISAHQFSSRYTYVFRLDSSQARKTLQGIQRDSSIYLTHKVDSFFTDSAYAYDQLGWGFYYAVSARASTIQYKQFHKEPFIKEVWGINSRNFVTLKDPHEQIIHDAAVTLIDGTPCPFVKGIGAYEIPARKVTVMLKMQYRGQWDYLYVNPEYVQAPKPKNVYPDYRHTMIAPGYLVFNQPKFKFYDTLKFKAFLLQDNGKPYKEKLRIYLSLDGKDKFIGSYKPQTPGAYFGQFEISDTLQIDKNYTLVFRNMENEVIKSNTFIVENYELKPNRYTLQGPPANCLVGDKVELTVAAFNANNLPVMDAVITVDLRIADISRYFLDRQFIPDKWLRESYFHLELNSDPSGNTSIVFPDSLFLNFDANYEVIVTIRDADNHTKNMRAVFNYNNRLYAYHIKYEFDSLVVRSFFKAKPQSQDLILETTYRDTIIKSVIATPYSQPLDFYAKSYRLYLGDSLLLEQNAYLDYASMVYFAGKRNADSVHIRLVNPIRLPVYYEIYRDRVKVGEGYGSTIDYHAADLSQLSYHVVWGYNQPGEFRNSFKVKSFHLYETRLNVLIKQPAEIYPGQTTDISIEVTDQFNKGVPDVNLTAYAVNMEFENIPLPDVPYMGLTRGAYPLTTVRPMGYLPDFSHSCVLKAYHFNVLNLFGNEMYALLYGKGGKTVVQMPIKRRTPELSVYVYQKHQLQNIVYIKIDSQLVYHQYYVAPSAFSFPLSKGRHSVSVRTFDRLLIFDQLLVTDSVKYVLGFNLDSLEYVADTMMYLTGKLKSYEKNEFLDHALFLRIHDWSDTLEVFQGRGRKIFSRKSTFYNTATMRIGLDNYTPVGPVKQGKMKLLLDHHNEYEFSFSRGYACLILKDEIKQLPLPDGLRQYGFISSQLFNQHIYNLSSFDALSYVPEYDTLRVHPPEVQKVNEEETPDRTRPEIDDLTYIPKDAGERHQGVIRFVFPGDQLFTKSWLINKSVTELSSINNQERDRLVYYGSDLHDLLLFNDSSFAIYRDLPLQTDGTFVLFVKPEHFKPFDLEQIYHYDQIIAGLIRQPLRDFTDTPVIIKPVVILKKKYASKYARVTGTVVDARYHTPVDYANIYLEIEGYFKAGATSNPEGKFMLDSLPPGNYMLKIRSSDYRYHIIYKLVLEKGKEVVINIGLIHKDDEIYYTADGDVKLTHLSRPEVVSENIEYVFGSNAPISDSKYYSAESNKIGMRSLSGAGTYAYGMAGRASRADGSAVYVDGVRVNNSGQQSIGMEENTYINRDYAKTLADDLQGRMDALALVTQANRVRDHFRDYGYWIPNLLTDAQGKAHFTVTFPDNITSWQTMVPAMNGKRQSGMGTVVTRSFKPLYTLMTTPFFLTEGDRIVLKGRVLNYTGKEQQVKIRFTLNERVVSSRSTAIGNFLVDTLSVKVAKGIDTLKSSFMFDMENGYTDGEAREIPVRPNGIMISQSRQILLKSDTVLRVRIPADAVSAKILVQNSEAERLMQEIENLKNYSYGCIEQTTSKLRALLAEKVMREALGLPFTQDKLVRKMIHRLNTSKNSYGTWSWWGGSSEEDWLSAYVMKTLNQARLAGYSNNAYVSAAKRLEKKLPGMPLESRLYALNALWDMERDIPYDSLMTDIHLNELNDQQKLLYLRLRQKTGKPYELLEVTRLLRHSETGGIYFGAPVMRYYNDVSSTTLLAYDLLSHNDSGSEYLPYIRDFMYSSAYPQHTFALAEMISVKSVELLQKKKTGIKITGDVTVNGYLIKPADYPFRNRLIPGDTVSIKHSGPEAFATIVTSRLETSPQVDNTYFSIKTSLAGQADNVRLAPGRPVELLVNVDVYKNSEHVMMEIPLPAGFSYYEKIPATGMETYREYFYDKTSVFCSSLTTGHYVFRIMVVPRFSGTFNLPPAKIELMYYPEIHNNEKTKVVEVE
jgi:hypothetical protein